MNYLTCKNCGGTILGDGYTKVLHCEMADPEDTDYAEPDANIILCRNDIADPEDTDYAEPEANIGLCRNATE